jgi:flagellar protein FliS
MHSRVGVYRKVSIESASPVRMLDEVYERFLRACREAGEGMERKDLAAKGMAIGKALAFLGALESALDHGAAPDLSANLLRLYRFVFDKLSEANAKNSPKALAEAEQVITTLRDAFRAAAP